MEVPLKIKYEQETLVQYMNVHCTKLLYNESLIAVNRPPEKEGNKKIVNLDMRQLHYKKVKGGMRQLQEFKIEIKDSQGQLGKFEEGQKTIMPLNFKPTGSKELGHFTENVLCQTLHKLEVPIALKTTDRWQVALMDITFPKRWINVKENEIVFYMGTDGVYDQDVIIPGNTQSVFSPTKYVLRCGNFTSRWYRFYIYPNSQLLKWTCIKDWMNNTPVLCVKITEPLCQALDWETYVKVKEQMHSLDSILVEIRNEQVDMFEFTDVGQRPTASLKFEVE